jgi:predicted dehydrogenase
VIATPDHTHAVAASMAMKLGKHVYVQKPLTYSVHEARFLAQLARETGVVTQMGNQGHSRDDGRRVVEWVRSGILGPVRQAHIWTNRPIWPQGVPRPTDSQPVPAHLNWDLFLGPAPDVPYHSSYTPFNWRGWTDWGTGALGDMGAHLIDHAYWALELDAPTWIEASGSPYGGGAERASFPLATMVHYGFERPDRHPVRVSWYDGGLLPARPEVVPADAPINLVGGVMLIGDKGVLMYDTYGSKPQIYPKSLEEEAAAVPQSLPRIAESHEMNWALACTGKGQASCPFSYAGPLTETMLLGMAALRAGYGRRVSWDGKAGKFTDADDANEFLHRPYRNGWEL